MSWDHERARGETLALPKNRMRSRYRTGELLEEAKASGEVEELDNGLWSYKGWTHYNEKGSGNGQMTTWIV